MLAFIFLGLWPIIVENPRGQKRLLQSSLTEEKHLIISLYYFSNFHSRVVIVRGVNEDPLLSSTNKFHLANLTASAQTKLPIMVRPRIAQSNKIEWH
jgi:hypothetical protein